MFLRLVWYLITLMWCFVTLLWHLNQRIHLQDLQKAFESVFSLPQQSPASKRHPALFWIQNWQFQPSKLDRFTSKKTHFFQCKTCYLSGTVGTWIETSSSSQNPSPIQWGLMDAHRVTDLRYNFEVIFSYIISLCGTKLGLVNLRT